MIGETQLETAAIASQHNRPGLTGAEIYNFINYISYLNNKLRLLFFPVPFREGDPPIRLPESALRFA
jgi:hypothetical protein